MQGVLPRHRPGNTAAEAGYHWAAPQGYTPHMQVEGLDGWWKRAVEAVCVVEMPLEKQFWGDRYGRLRDPYGVLWALGEGDAG